MGLAKSLTGLKAYDEARLLFEEVLTDNDRVMEAYDWLAKLYRNNHNLDEAQATLKQATDISPVVFRRQQQLAEVALLNNQLEVAEEACQTTLDIAKYTWHRSPTHYAALARVQLARGDTANVGRTLSNLRRDYRYNEEGEWMAGVVDSQLQDKRATATRPASYSPTPRPSSASWRPSSAATRKWNSPAPATPKATRNPATT